MRSAMRIHCTVRRSATRIHCTVRAIQSQCAARTVNIHVWSDSIASSVCHLFAWKKCVVSINVPPPQLWGGQHTEMFVDHVTVFSQSVSHIRLSHTIYQNVIIQWKLDMKRSDITNYILWSQWINFICFALFIDYWYNKQNFPVPRTSLYWVSTVLLVIIMYVAWQVNFNHNFKFSACKKSGT